MEALAVAMGAANEAIEHHLGTLEGRAATLRRDWSGEASEAYDDAQREWRSLMSELNGILAKAGGSASTAAQLHLAARAKVERLWA